MTISNLDRSQVNSAAECMLKQHNAKQTIEFHDNTPVLENNAKTRQAAFVAGALRRDLLMRYGDLTGISPSLSIQCMADEQFQRALDILDADFPDFESNTDIMFQAYESGLMVLCNYFGDDNVTAGENIYVAKANLSRPW